jgi:hypothetical protein
MLPPIIDPKRLLLRATIDEKKNKKKSVPSFCTSCSVSDCVSVVFCSFFVSDYQLVLAWGEIQKGKRSSHLFGAAPADSLSRSSVIMHCFCKRRL